MAWAGRVGETLLGRAAPVASTSRPWAPCVASRRGAARPRGGARVCAQLQREGKQDEPKAPASAPAAGSNSASSNSSSNGSQPAQAAANGSSPPAASANGAGEPQPPASSGNWLSQQWDNLAPQYKIVFACACAFVICNMDKVNISVAIISMSRDFGWSTTVSGVVQSSFFAGYMFTQIPGGYVVGRLGGRRVLPAGVTTWSGATAVTPLLASSLPGMLACRALVGLGEGVAPTSATDMVARVCAQEERSRAIGFMFSGLHLGSLAGLLVAPILIEKCGWPAVFYIFGGAGLVWSVWWERLLGGLRQSHPDMMSRLEDVERGPGGSRDSGGSSSSGGSSGSGSGKQQGQGVPWRAFFRSTPVRALAYTHFCNNWAAYTTTAWLPSYFSTALSLDLTQASQAALFPPLAATIASLGAGPIADHLVSSGVPVAIVRKSFQGLAFLGPSMFLGLVFRLGGGANNEMLTVGLVSAALGLASVSVAGLYSNHADLSRRHASILLGLTNTVAAVPGIIGVTITGVIYDRTNDWNLALFAPAIFFYTTGAAVFAIFGSADQEPFDDNEPLWFEKYLSPVTSRLGVAAGRVSAGYRRLADSIRKDQ